MELNFENIIYKFYFKKIMILYIIFIFIFNYKSNIFVKFFMKSILMLYKYENSFNIIPISYGLNNKNVYITLISISSILENANNNTYYLFYIMVSNNKSEFSNYNKRKLKYIEKKYNNCNIFFIGMDDSKFKYARINRYPIPTYYRLLLAELLPNINKIIYLDGDTIILTDLTDMLNINMNNNIVMGFLDNAQRFARIFGIKTNKYITAGVILLNLELIRKEKFTQKFFDFIKKNNKLLKQEDQTVINIVLHKRVGILPAKFGLWTFYNKTQFFFHNHYQNYTNSIQCYNDTEMNNAWYQPKILHYVMNKPYINNTYILNSTFTNYWLYYASISWEFDKIIQFYNLSLLKKYKLNKFNNNYILVMK